MIVFHPSIPHCNCALNPLLVWFHRAYNQCTGEFPINTTHSTSVASLTPSPHTLRAQQRLLELIRVCTHIHNIHIHEHVRSLVHLDQKNNNNTQLHKPFRHKDGRSKEPNVLWERLTTFSRQEPEQQVSQLKKMLKS